MKIWLVEHPLFAYKEDVIALAKKADLRIIDKCFSGDFKSSDIESNPPTITKKTAKKLEADIVKVKEEELVKL